MSFVHRRDLRIAIAGRTIGLIGDQIAAVALLLRLQGNGGGPIAAAALLMAALVPLAVFSAPAGRLVDRYDNRTLLVGVSLAQAVLCTALAFVDATPVLLALVFAVAVGEAITSTVWLALVPAIASGEEVPRALGWMQTWGTASFIVGPAVAGVLAGVFDTRVPLLVDAASFVVVAAAAAALHTRRAPSTTEPTMAEVAGRLAEGFSLWRDPFIRALTLLLATFVLVGAGVNVVEVFLIRETLHASSVWVGLFTASWAVGMMAGAQLGARLNTGIVRPAVAAIGGCASLGAVLFGLGLVPSILWIVPLTLLGGSANGVLNVTASTQLLARAPEQAHGRAMGALGSVINSAQALAYVLGAALGTALGIRQTFLAGGALSVLAVAVLGPPLLRSALREHRSARRPGQQPETQPGLTPHPALPEL